MPTDPHWTAYLSALLTPIVAVLGTVVALQQWRTARNKLKFDLFQRRLAVYQAAQSFLVSVFRTGKVSDEELSKYATGTREALWLYGPEIVSFFRENIWTKAIDLQCLQAELEGVPKGAERSENVHKQSELKKFLNSRPKAIDEKCEQYLRMYH